MTAKKSLPFCSASPAPANRKSSTGVVFRSCDFSGPLTTQNIRAAAHSRRVIRLRVKRGIGSFHARAYQISRSAGADTHRRDGSKQQLAGRIVLNHVVVWTGTLAALAIGDLSESRRASHAGRA